jgi:8-oxo-dGTP pyrophosphatase MutT (NUDIX family)
MMITFTNGPRQFTLRVAGVCLEKGRVLLHRLEGDSFWILPGGRAEHDEPSVASIERELFEETGCRARSLRLLWVVENFFTFGEQTCHELGLYHLVEFPRDARVFDGDAFWGVEGNQRLEYRWFAFEQLADLVIYPAFLKDRLLAIPSGIDHVVHRDAPEVP